jgi:hypothetical protein
MERREARTQVSYYSVYITAAASMETVTIGPLHSPMKWFGHANPNDPNEQAYLRELARLRKKDLERTLRENDRC